MISDACKIGCDFIALLGDVMDSDEPNPLRINRYSAVPIIYQHGDHELFNEWGRSGFRNYDSLSQNGERRNDPLSFFRGATPRQEALTHLPTAWSFELKGIHFVVCYNGKDIVWYPWFLRWLEEDLKKTNETTILLSHRPLNDAGETAEAMRKIVEKYPSVRLYCYGHTHSSSPFYKVGNAICLNAEADSPYDGKTYEGNWYVFVEIAKDAIRIFRRIMDKDETALLFEEKGQTTLKPRRSWERVNMAYLMSDGGVRSLPPIPLKESSLRVYGVKAVQILEQNEAILGNKTKGKFQASAGDWRKLGVEKVLQLKWEGEGINDWVELVRWEIPVHFEDDPQRVGEAGTIEEGTIYMPLMLVKGREGEKVKLLVECLRGDGSLESKHWVEGVLGEGIGALWALTGHIKFNSPNPYWRWMGAEGKTEVDNYNQPRRAVEMRIILLAQPMEGENYEVIAFVYPSEAFFAPLRKGKWNSEGVKVRIGGKEFLVGDLGDGEAKDFPLGELRGGEKIILHCEGSKLALIEVKGKAKSLLRIGGD